MTFHLTLSLTEPESLLDRWADDDPHAPWNVPISWTRECNEGAHWFPPGFDSLVVCREPRGHRRHGLYSVRTLIAGHFGNTPTASEALFYYDNLDGVRAYLRDHWRLNHMSPEEEAEYQRQKAERQAREAEEAERERARRDEESRLANEWRAQQAEREKARKEEAKRTGAWMDDYPRLAAPQRKALLAALETGGLDLSHSYEVHDLAQTHRVAVGGTWAACYRFGVDWHKGNLKHRVQP